MNKTEMIQLALNEGFSAAETIDINRVIFDPAFRPFCEENLCGQYGANYSCPPDCGTPEEMKARIAQYPNGIVFQTKWPITDYTDTQAIREAKRAHNQGMLRVIERMKQAGHTGVMAGASCCNLCDRCAILDGEPCCDDDRRFSCLSAYCVYVKALAEACDMEYICADGQLALFGLYAFA